MSDPIHSVNVLDRPAPVVERPTVAPMPAGASVALLETTPQPARQSFLAWAVGALPTALLLLLLAGIAYWGHVTDWTIPKFSEWIGNGTTTKQDWCDEHSVPESICVECKETLLPRIAATWCRKHGVHYCPFERPEIAQLAQTPVISKSDLDRAQRGLDLKDRPENNPRCKLVLRRLQFASTEIMDKMGIGVEPVFEAPIVETISASGEITFEQPRVAPISAPVSGRVWYVTAQGLLGAAVKRGDLLALVDAADVGKAKAEFLQSFAQADLKAKALERMKPLSGTVYSVAQIQEAESALRETEIRLMVAQQALVNLGLPVQLGDVKGLAPEDLTKRLQFFGVPPEIAHKLDPKTTTASLMPVLAARDGVVTASKVVPGQMVDPSQTLFVISDTSQMWLILHVRSEDLKYLRAHDDKSGTPGQDVRFRPDGNDHDVTGELVWISKSVDERTRTVQVRANLPNADGKLLANTFGHGSIVLRTEKSAVVVPNEALHWEKDCTVVFVRDKDFLHEGAAKVFHVRSVRVGAKNGSATEIIAGLLPGEVIATKNSANLRAELLKNSLGAG